MTGKKDLRNSGIMIFAHGDGAKMKLVSRKLDNLGYINSYGGTQNDPERLSATDEQDLVLSVACNNFSSGADGFSAGEGHHCHGAASIGSSSKINFGGEGG